MSSNLSTEATGPATSSSNVGTGTVGELKTDFANLLINRVSLGECLNVIRDACVARAADIIDEADEAALENIRKDVALFKDQSSTSDDSKDAPPSSVGDLETSTADLSTSTADLSTSTADLSTSTADLSVSTSGESGNV